MMAGEARGRLVVLEKMPFIPGQQDHDSWASRRVFHVTDEEQRRAGISDARRNQRMTITQALRAAARNVEEHKATLAWDGPEMLSEAEKARIVAEVSALGHELDGLAAASETARV